MAEEGYRVTLNVYDLSQGLARQLSTAFLGKAIDGIWHTGVVVYGNEYYFGGGISHAPAGTTPYGMPIKVVDLGVTHVPRDVFEMYLDEISPRYTAETYSLLTHNCNNFSNEVAQFLVGTTIPNYILQLPNEVMGSPMGALILPMIQNLETTLKAGAVPQVPQFRAPVAANPFLSASTADKSLAGNLSTGDTQVKAADKVEFVEKPSKPEEFTVSKKIETPTAHEEVKSPSSVQDPLENARSKVQDEISREFAEIMATGTFRASEAAALATKRVMKRYGYLNVAMPQG